MIYKPIKYFYIFMTLVSSSLTIFFLEVGNHNLSASACLDTKLTQDQENILKKIQNLQVPISIYHIHDDSRYRCGNNGIISVHFIDAQGTEFIFGTTRSGKLFFNTVVPLDEGTVWLKTGYKEAQTILLNLVKDWLQNHPQSEQPQQHETPEQREQEDEYRRLLILLIERVENRENNLSSDGN